jgi:hypothetical protein
MKDDRVISGTFDVPYVYSESDWGLHETYTKEETLGSYVWDAPVKDFATDLPRLRFPEITVDHDATNRMLDLAREIVVLLDRLELVAQVFLDDVFHVGRQVGQALLDVRGLGPDPAGDE